MIIAFSGTKGSGKDTAAGMVADEFSHARAYAFAGELKRICRAVFGLSVAQTDGWAKEVPLPEAIDMDDYLKQLQEAFVGDPVPLLAPAGCVARTPRQLLQYFGTEYVRAAVPDYWVRFVLERASLDALALITDCRFQNEVDAVRGAGGVVIRINRFASPADAHESEAGIAKLRGCIDVDNTSSLDDLRRNVLWLAVGSSK